MSTDTRRVLLATALSAAILFAFMGLQSRNAPHRGVSPADAGPAATASGAGATPAAPAAAPSTTAAPVAPVPAAPEETVVLDTPELKATFSSLGGALRSLELKGEKFRRQGKGGDEAPVDLVHVTAGQPWPGALVASAELGGSGGLSDDPGAKASMRITARDARSVTFEGMVGAAQVRKRWFVGERPYELGLDLHATSNRKGELTVLYPRTCRPTRPSLASSRADRWRRR